MDLLSGSLMLVMMAARGQSAAAPRAGNPEGTERDAGLGYEVNFDTPYFVLGQNGTLKYNISMTQDSVSNPATSKLGIILCQTNQASTYFNSDNSYKLVDVQLDICIYLRNIHECDGHQSPVKANVLKPNPVVGFVGGNNANSMGNYFFCFAIIQPGTSDICRFYSNLFNLVAGSPLPQPGQPILAGTAISASMNPAPSAVTMRVTSTDVINLMQTQQTFTNSPSTASTSSVPTPDASTFTKSIPNTSTTAAAQNPSIQTHSSYLSTGAKIGIALGALAFVSLLLLAALFCLRKAHAKKRSRSQSEQVMLTRDMHADSFTRNALILEKDLSGPTSTTIPHDPTLDTPIESTSSPSSTLPIPMQARQTRHEPVPSSLAAVPKRKPTAATVISTVSRGLSTNSRSTTTHPVSPRSVAATTTTASGRSGETHAPPRVFEEYHDVTIYGDTRHVPQIYTGSDRRERGVVGGSASPFLPLGEETEGMSAEEVARLEEEERRIDAAIAAAEAGEQGQGRGR